MSVYRTIGPLVLFGKFFEWIFSSPEPKAHGELIVYQSSCRLCVCQCVCPHF